MLPDAVDLLNEEQKRLYISVLAMICAADGELVREEMAALEEAMGRVLLHPEARNEIRQLLVNEIDIDNLIQQLDEKTARLVLRDGFLIAACDGDYDKKELSILAQIQSASGLGDDVVTELIGWVDDRWKLSVEGREIVSSQLLGDDSA